MDPTFHHGEYLIVDQLSYRFNKPERGDIIVFKYPNDHNQFFIKRVIGLPGERIKMEGSNITIYNEDFPEGKTLDEPYIKQGSGYGREPNVSLNSSEYYVLGDNRSESSDSRSWGPLRKELIIGRPLVRLLPPSSISFLPGIS